MPYGRFGTSFVYPIHSEMPYSGFEERRADGEIAFELARSIYHNEQPYVLFFELMQRAVQAWNTHRFAQAIISIGTAIEVMVSVTVTEASPLLGEPTGRAEAVLNAGLANVFRDHLARYIGVPVDFDDTSTPFGHWWNGGYKLRNQVVHSAHRPTEAETQDGFDGAMEVIMAVGDGLRANPTTEPLGATLAWGKVDQAPTP